MTLGPDDQEAVRVLLVDDAAMFREMLAATMGSRGDTEIVGEYSTVSEAKEALPNTNVDLAIVDTGLPDGSGVEVVRHLKIHNPSAKAIMLTIDRSTDLFISAVGAGVDAYVLKYSPLEQLMDSMQTVLLGGCVYDCEISNSAIRALVQRSAGDYIPRNEGHTVDIHKLSVRERQVAELLSKGLSNKEIAQALSISVSTTKTHVGKVFKHFGISARREMLPRMYRLGSPNDHRET